ncbi:MAG: hypothetical protein KGQ41_03165 [Alphaproteobacteria bacterium]|nr:hypothetical protein [Alphaproteobacteria bacterium]
MRKLFLAAVAVLALSVPAMAEDAPKAAEGHEGHGKMMQMKNDADTDGDGFLSKAEFMAMHEKRFAEMDGDSDGKISKDEMKAFFGKMKEKMQAARKEMGEKMKEMKEENKGEQKPE